jgi:DNA-directed RNA polymerase subunit K/omega
MFISSFFGLGSSFEVLVCPVHRSLNQKMNQAARASRRNDVFEPRLDPLSHVEAIKLSDNVVIGPPKLTRFERARIVGARALQVSLGAPILVQLQKGVSDAIDIAIQELNERVLPMTVRRTLPEGTFQDIPLIDLLGSP